MEISLYFQMLKRGWWVIALTMLTALIAALAVTYLASPQYRSVARFIITPGTSLINGTDVLNSLDTLDRQSVISTYAGIMNSDRIHSDALSYIQLKPQNVQTYTYGAVVVSNSSVLELTVSGPNAKMTADLANAIGYETINFTRQLNHVYNVDFLDIAVPATDPYSPNPLLNASLAVGLGLIVGAALVILNEQLRNPLETLQQRSHMDGTTGVYNNKYFTRMVEDELSNQPDNVRSVGIIELNGLRDLVDTLPLMSLRRVLQKVTEILRNELRGNDVIGRWNEISFIIMLPNTAGMAAKGICERIMQALERPVDLDQLGADVSLDPHIGVAEYGNHISSQELLDKANNALEKARRDNKKPVSLLSN